MAALNTRFDKDFYLRVDSLLPIKNFFLSYLVIGSNPSTLCTSCSDKIVSDNGCVA